MTNAIQSSSTLIHPLRQEPVQASHPVRNIAQVAKADGESAVARPGTDEGRQNFDTDGQSDSRGSAPLTGRSALTTYRDQDSGRVIVRLFDKDSGHVLAEFPPEKAYRPVAPANFEETPRPQTRVDV